MRIRNRVTGESHELAAVGVFIFIGYTPGSERFRGLVALNENGEILTDENMATSLAGVFAAGDIRQKKVRQITTAVADGTEAAIGVIEYLRTEEPAEAREPAALRS